MKAYTFFPKVYDRFMWDIPYAEWADGIEGYMDKAGIPCGARILELGCGTGRMTKILAADGYYMTGLDLSGGMVKRARKNSSGYPIKYITADMRDFKLGEEYDAVISVCDSMNYLLDVGGLHKTMLNVKKHLKTGGIFIFDMKTEAFYLKLGDNIYSDKKGNAEYYWENSYDSDSGNNYYSISFYVKRFMLYRKFTEEHVQHFFPADDVLRAAEDTGMVLMEILGENMVQPAGCDDDRIYYILSRP